MQILSFDIGGTKIAYALADERGNILSDVKKIPTPKTANEIETALRKIVAAHTFDGLAFASAGVVYKNRFREKPLNLPAGYEKIDFLSLAKVPVSVENDANAAAWCEYKIGNAAGCNHAVILALGTGVGCGIVCDGKLLKGKSGAAGECSFKISGKDLTEAAEKHNLPKDCFALHDLVKENNKVALKVYNLWHNRLASAVVLLNNLFDTQKIVLAGSLAEIADYKRLQIELNNHSFGEAPLICKTKGHNFPALAGAAILWYDTYKNERN